MSEFALHFTIRCDHCDRTEGEVMFIRIQGEEMLTCCSECYADWFGIVALASRLREMSEEREGLE